jgi:hypothetical protein
VGDVTIGQEREQSTPSMRLPARAVRTPIGWPVGSPENQLLSELPFRCGVNSASAA